MINSQVFNEEMAKLSAYFKTEFSDYDLSTFKEFLSPALDTQEFIAACTNARRKCQGHRSFVPSSQWMIDSVLGTLEERAVIQFQNLDRLSHVGSEALKAIGGNWAIQNSDRMALKRDFTAHYLAFAKNASPDELRMPVEPSPQSSPAPRPQHQEPPPEKSRQLTLADKLGILRCECNFEGRRAKAWEEAKRYGFTVNMSPRIAENQRITLSPGQDPNQLIDDRPEDMAAAVRSLTNALSGKVLQPIGF